MNKYFYEYFGKCPVDNQTIRYEVEILSEGVIFVEKLTTMCAIVADKIQEEGADVLFTTFGGKQTITGTHQGVKIVTTRGF